jgi:hypothetical protein
MGFMKPFKTPSLVGKNTLNSRPPPLLDEDRPTKRRRIGADDDDDSHTDSGGESVSAAANILKTPKVVSRSIPKFQTPLQQKQVNAVANPTNASSSSQGSEEKTSKGQEGYYTVLWYVSDASAVI